MTKIEKQMIAAVIVVLVLMVVSMIFLVESLKPGQQQIDHGGLKSFLSEIWNGNRK